METGKKVLTVDDDIVILNMVKAAFGDAGYEVFAAENAEQALKILGQENNMVMFLDIDLPGMNGIDLCKRIRKENQIAILHAFTGHTNLFGLLECRASGFDDFFEKPAKIKDLLKAAKEAFERLERWNVGELI